MNSHGELALKSQEHLMLPERWLVVPLGSRELRRLQPELVPLVVAAVGPELEFPFARRASGSEAPRRSGFSSTEHKTYSDPAGTDGCASVADAVGQAECSSAARSAHAGSSSRAEWCRSAWR